MSIYKNATIGRVQNGAMAAVPFTDGDSVSSLLLKAKINLVQGEEVNDSYGNPVALTALASEMTYYIVRNMKNGKN